MIKLIILLLIPINVLAWYDTGFYYGMLVPMVPYGMSMYPGFMYGIPAPSFNYSTVIIQEQIQPRFIQEPQIIYRDRYRPCDDQCFKRYYSK